MFLPTCTFIYSSYSPISLNRLHQNLRTVTLTHLVASVTNI